MKPSNLLLPVILACLPVSPVLANPCSSLATAEPSEQTRKFENRELSFEIPGNFRIMGTQSGLMIHSPWSYEVYTCQIKSQYGSGEIEKGILVYTLPFNKSSEITDDLDGQGSNSNLIETTYSYTSAKMYVYNTIDGAEARIVFIKKNKLVVIETPMSLDDNRNPSIEIPSLYKPIIDLIISTINLK